MIFDQFVFVSVELPTVMGESTMLDIYVEMWTWSSHFVLTRWEIKNPIQNHFAASVKKRSHTNHPSQILHFSFEFHHNFGLGFHDHWYRFVHKDHVDEYFIVIDSQIEFATISSL